MQVHVHWLNTHEMTAVIGQSNSTSVLLRGLPGTSRNVALFCSHPDELQLTPTRMRLPAAMQVEVKLRFHPLATGTLNMVVTVIDSDTRGLVDALLISTHARAPHVSRTFEVDLPVGTIVNKKVCCATSEGWRVGSMPGTHCGLVMEVCAENDLGAASGCCMDRHAVVSACGLVIPACT